MQIGGRVGAAFSVRWAATALDTTSRLGLAFLISGAGFPVVFDQNRLLGLALTQSGRAPYYKA
jgi:hypothetical protein